LQDHVSRSLHRDMLRRKNLCLLRKSHTAKKECFERTDICFVAALIGSDRFRLCNDVKKSDTRPRVKMA